ncbi:hypothetical protein AMJ49_02830 [Parcubacteria bacterium DG_74_2]|nr:MAG: hypothetical protein AMJ49_02830 [Parcubacteria bacterium DG_74_2]
MKKTLLIKVIAGIVIAVVVGLTSVLYARIFDPLWNPFRPSPETVLTQMTKKMSEIKTSHSETDFEIVVKNEAKIEIGGKFLTDLDDTDSANPKSKGNFDFYLTFDGTSFSFGGESVAIDKASFFKLTTTPVLPEYLLKEIGLETGLNLIKNQWIKIDLESMIDWLKEFMKGELPLGTEEIFEKSIEKQIEMEEKIKRIIEEKLAMEQLFLIKKELPDEKIGEMKVYHYLLVLNQTEAKKMMLEITGIYFDIMFETMIENLPEPFRPSPEEIENAKKEAVRSLEEGLDGFFTKIGEIGAETWIGKKDLLLYKVKIEKEIDLADLFEGEETGEIFIKANIILSKFGEVIEIKEPEEFKNIGEIFEEILGPAIRKAQSKSRDEERKSDMRQIQVAMEFYYTDYSEYFQSKVMPTKIEAYYTPIPQDPGSGPCLSYQWISNIKNSQKFCVWACLENGNFYIVSHKGIKEFDEPPQMLDCW